MVKNELENMIYDMQQNLGQQGISLDDYMKWTGKTPEQVMDEAKPEAEKRIKTRILLKNIIRMEGIKVSAKEVEDLMAEFGAQYGMTAEQVKEMAGPDTEKYFTEDAQTKEAIELLFKNAKFSEVEVIKEK